MLLFIAIIMAAVSIPEATASTGVGNGTGSGFTGDDDERYQRLREQMVNRQIIARGVENRPTIRAMRNVPRHMFVRESERRQAYLDSPLPIGHGQTISQPFIVAYMTQLIDPEPGMKVLEIGTGSGYQAAVLAKLVRHVYTIEIVETLAVNARTRLQNLDYANVTVRHGDGHEGWPEQAPFDRIIVTAAPEEIPQALVDQLKDGGLMVIPIAEDGWAQTLYLVRKNGDQLEKTALADVIFVPMTGGDD